MSLVVFCTLKASLSECGYAVVRRGGTRRPLPPFLHNTPGLLAPRPSLRPSLVRGPTGLCSRPHALPDN